MAVPPVILKRYGDQQTNRGDSRAMRRRSDPSLESAAHRSFVDFYEAHADSVLRYCLVRISNPAEAEDAAAMVLNKAFAAWPPDNPTAARSWVFAIAHNVVANHYRTQSSHPAARSIDDAIGVPDRADLPSEVAEARDVQLAIRAAVAELTDDQREVIELRLAGLNGPEIAEATSRSHAAVKMLQYRAMQNLRSILSLSGEY